jgi:hypothetical protein
MLCGIMNVSSTLQIGAAVWLKTARGADADDFGTGVVQQFPTAGLAGQTGDHTIPTPWPGHHTPWM